MPLVTPAYGRDYTSAKAAIADWRAGRDFILRNPLSPWDGKPISIEADTYGDPVTIRYARGRRKVVVPAVDRSSDS